MNPKKIGAFLQALRKEKRLTKEQLAEHFNVSNRTVSRWETGTNMPDISLLVELAEFYSVDIREIIDGERKNEKMNEDIKSVATKMADYADAEKKLLLRRVRIINIIGLIAGCIAMMLRYSSLPEQTYFFMMLMDIAAGFSVGTMIYTLLYTTGVLEKVREKVKVKRTLKVIGYVAFAIVAMCLSIAAVYIWTR